MANGQVSGTEMKAQTLFAAAVVIVLAAAGSASAQGWIGRGAKPEGDRPAPTSRACCRRSG